MVAPQNPAQSPELFVRWLRQVAPYVHAFRGRTFVIGFGGELFTELRVRGVEGLREIRKEPFDLIICDMMMPMLSGDMFYLAVEKLKPALRNRFIFMTGHRSNPTVTNFVKNVDTSVFTFVLEKPFLLSELLEALLIVESKSGSDN